MPPSAPTSAISPRALLGTAVDDATDLAQRLAQDPLGGEEVGVIAAEVGALADLARATGAWGGGGGTRSGLPASIDRTLLGVSRDADIAARLVRDGDTSGAAAAHFADIYDALDALAADLEQGALRLPPDMQVPVQPALATIGNVLDHAPLPMQLLHERLLPRLSSPMLDVPVPAQPTAATRNGADGALLVDARGGVAREADPLDNPATSFASFTINESERARAGAFERLLAPQKLVDDVVSGIADPNKAGVIVVGEPGGGKTNIVRAAVRQMARERVRLQDPDAIGARIPRSIVDRDVARVDLARLIAGTRYRGDLEDKLVNFIKAGYEDGVIPFLDEAHDVAKVGAGEKEGGASFASLLKTITGDSDIKMVLTTTYDEYKLLAADGGAFLERFKIVRMPPPTPQEAFDILRQGVRTIEEKTGIWVDPPNTQSFAAAVAARGEELSPYGAMPRIGIGILSNAAQRAAHRRDFAIATLAESNIALARRQQLFVDLATAHMGHIHQAQQAGVGTSDGIAALAEAKSLVPQINQLARELGDDLPEMRVRASDIDRSVAEVIDTSALRPPKLNEQQLNLAAVLLARKPEIRRAIDQYMKMNKVDKRQAEVEKQQMLAAVRGYASDPVFLRSLSRTAPEVRSAGDFHAQFVRRELIEFLKEGQSVTRPA